MNDWCPIEERMPQSGDCVLVFAKSPRYAPAVFGASWLAARSELWDGEDGFDESSCDYVEERDEYYFPEGWYGLGFYDGTPHNWWEMLSSDYQVTHWRPFPGPPKSQDREAPTPQETQRAPNGQM